MHLVHYRRHELKMHYKPQQGSVDTTPHVTCVSSSCLTWEFHSFKGLLCRGVKHAGVKAAEFVKW